MKRIIIICLLFLPLLASSEECDSVKYRYGLLIEIDGPAIDQLGFRYRITEESNIVLILRSSYVVENKHTLNDSKYRLVSAAVLYELSLYRIEPVSFFFTGGLRYRKSTFEYSTFDGSSLPPIWYVKTDRTDAIVGILGVGGEYGITERFSFFIHQNIEFESAKTTGKSIFQETNDTRTNIDIVDTKIGFAIFF